MVDKIIRMNSILLAAYGAFVVTLSTFTFNVAALRVAEDLYLAGYIVFLSYIVLLSSSYATEGQLLLVDGDGDAQSCR